VRSRYNLAVAQLQTSRPSAALSTLAPLAKSRDPEVLSLLAAAQDSAGQTQAALSTLETALRIAPKDERLYLDAAVLYQKSGLLAPAVKMLDHGFEQVPRSARLLAMRGVILAQLGELDRSEADFERAGSLEPDQTYSAAGLSVLFSETGRAEGAVKLLRGKIAAAPDDPVLNYLLADALLREGAQPGQPEFAEAERALLRAVRIKQDFARARAALGKVYLRAGRAEDAVKELSAALALDPSNRPALSQLSAALRKAGRAKEAADASERLRRQYERDLEAEATRQRLRLAP
jgi:tetratricopeptide (TPR) repeat protein